MLLHVIFLVHLHIIRYESLLLARDKNILAGDASVAVGLG